jgi:hypothetical protein
MAPVDLDRPAVVSLRPAVGMGRTVTVFAGTYGRALMVVAALPFPLRDRASIDVLDEEASEHAQDRTAA